MFQSRYQQAQRAQIDLLNVSKNATVVLQQMGWKADDHSELAAFLSPLRPENRHNAVRRDRTKDTCTWLTTSEEYTKWSNGDGPSIFCCTGDTGLGKTYLASHVIDSLYDKYNDDNSIVAYVYCDRIDTVHQSALNVLGALLSWILLHSGPDTEVTKEVTQRYKAKRQLNIEELEEMISKAVASRTSGKVYVCCDALDEIDSKERMQVLESLAKICSQSTTLRVFLTARADAGIKEKLEDLEKSGDGASVHYLTLTARHTLKDLVLFIDEQLKHRKPLNSPDNNIRKIIFERLASPKSTFLLTSLLIKHVIGRKTPQAMRNDLENYTFGISDTYKLKIEQVLTQSDAEDTKFGMRILQWTLFAARPLSLVELRYAISIEADTTEFGEDYIPDNTIVETALGLVTVDSGKDLTVRIRHHTLRDFLFQNQKQYFPDGQAVPALRTIRYITISAIDVNDGEDYVSGELAPFFGYASRYWGYHARKSQDNEEVVKESLYIKSAERSSALTKVGKRIYGNEGWQGIVDAATADLDDVVG